MALPHGTPGQERSRRRHHRSGAGQIRHRRHFTATRRRRQQRAGAESDHRDREPLARQSLRGRAQELAAEAGRSVAVTRTSRGALLAPIMALGLTWACKPQDGSPALAQTTEDAQGPQAPAARQASQGGATRTEKDLLGSKEIPADAYYGVQTARALENCQISGVPINHYPGFIEAWAIVKLAAAQGNTDVGAMKKEKLAAIEKAANALLQGKYHDQFTVD